MQYLVPASLLLIAACGIIARREDQVTMAGILLVNWAINTGFAMLFGFPQAWPLFMVVDYLTAIAVFSCYVSRWQGVVIGLFVVMEITHTAYGMSLQDDAAEYYYWWALFWEAMLQGAAGGGWLVVEIVRHRGGIDRSARPDLALARKKGEDS